MIVAHLADINFCNHENNVNNLKEGIADNKIYLTGSTIFSALNRLNVFELHEDENNYILLTLHRPENVDDEHRLKDIILGLKMLDYKIIFPIHPRTKDRINKINNLDTDPFEIIEPKNYDDFVKLMKSSKFIISDSGGLQEEAMLRKPLLIPRKHTERPEMLNVFNLLTYEISSLLENAKEIIANKSVLQKKVLQSDFLYGKDEVIDNYLTLINRQLFEPPFEVVVLILVFLLNKKL